jgi:DNA-binding IclR family transcriptional regulator
MIQSVHRALDILEYLARQPEQPIPLGQIAEGLGLNLATCANLIKTLVTRSYVEQAGPREGYQLGAMAHYLVREGPYCRDIVTVAEPLLADLAAELGENLVISRLHQARLFMLAEAHGDEALQVRRDLLLVEDAYLTANGRLLLAYLDEPGLAAFLRAKGLPGEAWYPDRDEAYLRQQLGAIREAGQYVDVSPQGLARAAFPIWQRGKVVAALGFYAPEFRFKGQKREEALQRLQRAAEEISERLNGPVAGGPGY